MQDMLLVLSDNLALCMYVKRWGSHCVTYAGPELLGSVE
jgi:hypothetical protein